MKIFSIFLMFFGAMILVTASFWFVVASKNVKQEIKQEKETTVFTPNWEYLHQKVNRGEHVYGRISVDFVDDIAGSGIHLYLVDGDKKELISSPMKSLFRDKNAPKEDRFAFDMTLPLKKFEKVTSAMRLEVESHNINDDSHPKIIILELVLIK